jgi:nucleoside-diphosphate-sugar epimerase
MNDTSKTIAVTGSSGLIGSHLVPVLVAKGYHLRTLSRRPRPHSVGVTQIHGDIRSLAVTRELIRGCGTVLHLAGIAHTTLHTRADREEAEQINLGGARNVLRASRDGRVCRVLLASSAHVYARQEGSGLDEQSPTADDSFYARTKLLVEQAGLEAIDATRGALQVVIARPCLTYGPGVRFNLESLLRAIRGRYYFQIRGKNPMRSFLSVGNAAAAMLHLAEHGDPGTIYNVADRHPLGLAEFVNSLADLMQVARPRQVPQFAVRAAITLTAPLQWIGWNAPLNRESLRKLTVPFTLNVERLAASGFHWPDSGWAARASMVEAFLATCRGRSSG